jgi:hypothetical protein
VNKLYKPVHTINNIYNINILPNTNICQTYPILAPPQIELEDDTEQHETKRFKNDKLKITPRKRALEYVVSQALTVSDSRRPKGLCSPGTAEGPTGQG